MPDEAREGAHEILARDFDFTMLRANVTGDGAREGELAISVLVIADGKCFDGAATYFCSQGRDGTRIEASAEKYAKGHIAHEMAGDRLFQQVAIASDVSAARQTFRLGCHRNIPILRDRKATLLADLEPMAGHEFANAAVHGLFA